MKNYLDLNNWHYGLTYAVLIITFLSAHEFGHYFASKFHRVDASLPYFIPVPFPEIMLFGTFGAVIVTRSPIPNRKALFDIGIDAAVAARPIRVLAKEANASGDENLHEQPSLRRNEGDGASTAPIVAQVRAWRDRKGSTIITVASDERVQELSVQ